MMIQDLLKQIKQPLDDYLSGKSAEKEVDWWNWKYQVR